MFLQIDSPLRNISRSSSAGSEPATGKPLSPQDVEAISFPPRLAPEYRAHRETPQGTPGFAFTSQCNTTGGINFTKAMGLWVCTYPHSLLGISQFRLHIPNPHLSTPRIFPQSWARTGSADLFLCSFLNEVSGLQHMLSQVTSWGAEDILRNFQLNCIFQLELENLESILQLYQYTKSRWLFVSIQNVICNICNP